MARKPAYIKEELKQIIVESTNFSEALRKSGKIPAGGNHKVIKEYCQKWQIDTSHFDPNINRVSGYKIAIPIEEILVKNSNYSRSHLKKRLYKAKLKKKECELCGQNEEWKGRTMSLILDHINGIRDDNRIENLRIVCPNCNATLDTHCGKNAQHLKANCPQCKINKIENNRKFCSQECYHNHRCGVDANRKRQYAPRLKSRKVKRPPYKQLVEEVDTMGWSATGRKYGVSDNAIRKWL